MLPAHERLISDDALRPKFDQRLVVEYEFLPFDRAAEIHQRVQRADRARVHRFVEERVAHASLVLRAVHRRVGVAKHVFGRVVRPVDERDADARRREELVSADTDRWP